MDFLKRPSDEKTHFSFYGCPLQMDKPGATTNVKAVFDQEIILFIGIKVTRF